MCWLRHLSQEMGCFYILPKDRGWGNWCSHDLVCQAQNYGGDYGEKREASMCSVRDKCASVQCAVGWGSSILCPVAVMVIQVPQRTPLLSLVQEKGDDLNSSWIDFFSLQFSWEINYLHSRSIRRQIFHYHFLYWRAYYDYIRVIVFKSKRITNISMSSVVASNYFCFQLFYSH